MAEVGVPTTCLGPPWEDENNDRNEQELRAHFSRLEPRGGT